jgi:hypothetical protein
MKPSEIDYDLIEERADAMRLTEKLKRGKDAVILIDESHVPKKRKPHFDKQAFYLTLEEV